MSVDMHFMKQFMNPERCFKRDSEIALFSEQEYQQHFLIGKSALEQLIFYSMFVQSEFSLKKKTNFV